MRLFDPSLNRRTLLRTGVTTGIIALAAPGAFADLLAPTPRLTEGPFYPDQLPLDTDNDLILNDHSRTPALGEITHLTGQVTDLHGNPIRDAVIEIWQVDHRGVYLNTRDSGHRQRDTNFQGYGRCPLSKDGQYRFRTIKPVPYTGRTPHIHLRVNRAGQDLLTTQVFINGHPQNQGDGVLGGVRNLVDRELLLADFLPIKDSKSGELTARFDIVLGATPAEGPGGVLRSPQRR